LAFCTFVVSVIPYLGAASVWIPVAIYLAFQERWLAACLLAVYGAVIVSSVDNLIRAYAIHDQAHIHPLVALVAILGAVRLLGLWGIIVGPVTAVLFHVLLELVSKRLEQARSRSSARAADYLTNPPEFNEI
jgi:predicted PurR-regulated permease PerM